MGESVAAVSLVTFNTHAGHMFFLEWSARMAVIMAVRSYRIQREMQQRINSEIKGSGYNRCPGGSGVARQRGHDFTAIIALTQGFADSVEVKEQLWLQAAHAQ